MTAERSQNEPTASQTTGGGQDESAFIAGVLKAIPFVSGIVGIFDRVEAAEAAKREKRFRDAVLMKLAQISKQVSALNEDLRILGVEIIEEMHELEAGEAVGRILAQLRIFADEYATVTSDPTRAGQLATSIRDAAYQGMYHPTIAKEGLVIPIAISLPAVLILLEIHAPLDTDTRENVCRTYQSFFDSILSAQNQLGLVAARHRLQSVLDFLDEQWKLVPSGRTSAGFIEWRVPGSLTPPVRYHYRLEISKDDNDFSVAVVAPKYPRLPKGRWSRSDWPNKKVTIDEREIATIVGKRLPVPNVSAFYKIYSKNKSWPRSDEIVRFSRQFAYDGLRAIDLAKGIRERLPALEAAHVVAEAARKMCTK